MMTEQPKHARDLQADSAQNAVRRSAGTLYRLTLLFPLILIGFVALIFVMSSAWVVLLVLGVIGFLVLGAVGAVLWIAKLASPHPLVRWHAAQWLLLTGALVFLVPIALPAMQWAGAVLALGIWYLLNAVSLGQANDGTCWLASRFGAQVATREQTPFPAPSIPQQPGATDDGRRAFAQAQYLLAAGSEMDGIQAMREIFNNGYALDLRRHAVQILEARGDVEEF